MLYFAWAKLGKPSVSRRRFCFLPNVEESFVSSGYHPQVLPAVDFIVLFDKKTRVHPDDAEINIVRVVNDIV